MKNRVADVDAEVLLIDPMGKLTSLSIYYIQSGAVTQELKSYRDGVWTRLPNAQRVDLKLEGQRAVGQFRIRSVEAVNVSYTYQAAYVDSAGGTIYSPPAVFSVDFTERSENLMRTAEYSASTTWDEPTYTAAKAFDGVPTSRWNSRRGDSVVPPCRPRFPARVQS